jgi:Ser/Thr protein kinase RdoA (MazF antagonist)
LIAARGHFWQLEPWRPGEADFWRHPTESRLRAAMHCLAQWHRAAAGFHPFPSEQPWFGRCDQAMSPAVGERLQLAGDWRSGRLAELRAALVRRPRDTFTVPGRRIVELFEQVSPSIAEELRVAGRLHIRLQPCLRDVWHDHVLFIGDEVSGLIDPSACRMETVASDLSRLLGSLVGDDAGAWRVGLEEYVQHNPLSVEELNLVPVLDRSAVLLSGLTWLAGRFLHGEEWPDQAAVLERLQRILVRLETLASTIARGASEGTGAFGPRLSFGRL